MLVVSSWGYPDAPVAGGKKLSRLANLGLAGLVADARLRDFAEVGRPRPRRLVPRRDRAPGRRGDHALRGQRARGAVGGVTVFPGDWVYADASGAVVIPPDDLRAILEEAARIEERDAAEVERLREVDALR